MQKKDFIIIITGLVIAAFLFFMGLSFKKKSVQTINVSDVFKVTFEKSNIVSLKNTTRLEDQEALKNKKLEMTIKNETEKDAYAQVRFQEENNNSKIVNRSDVKIAYKINGETYVDYLSNFSQEGVLLENLKLKGKEKIKIDMYLWYASDANKEVIEEDYQLSFYVDLLQLHPEDSKDTTAPVITLNGESILSVLEGEEFTDPFIESIFDDQDGEIEPSKVTIKYEYEKDGKKEAVTKIDTKKVGIYSIYYTVKDSANNQTTKIRVVEVKEKQDVVEQPSTPSKPEEPKEEMKLEVSYSTTKKTKEDVVVTITSNVNLQKIPGWTLNGKKLTKTYTSNQKEELLVKSEKGQTQIVTIKVENIDRSQTEPQQPTYKKPTVTLKSINILSNSITVKATSNDASKVAGYQFSCDGSTWSSLSKEETYTCKNLKHDTNYTISVQLVDIKNNKITTEPLTIKTVKIESPIIQGDKSWSTARAIKITYPTRASHYIYQYKLAPDSNWATLSSGTEKILTINKNTTIIARIIDAETNYNEVTANYIEDKIDQNPPTLNNPVIAVSEIETNSFKIDFTKASDNSTPEADLRYFVCLSKDPLTKENCKSYALNKEGDRNISHYAITNLDEEETYQVSVLVEDQFGLSSFYQVANATTKKTQVHVPSYGIDLKLDIADKNDLVGILYSTWFDYMHDKTPTMYDVSLKKFGNVGDFHYWGTPQLGYYNSTDKTVIRKHMTQLAEAGVDFIILDNTNVRLSWIGSGAFDTNSAYYKSVTAPVKALLDTIVEMRNEGLKTPYVVNWENTEDGWIMVNVFHNLFISPTYDPSLGNSKYENIWVYWDNKPLLLTTTSTSSLGTPDRDITYRMMWGLQPSLSTYEWSYLQKDNTKGGKDASGNYEQMGVSVAMQQTRMTNTQTATGRNHGITFYNQWKNAFNKRPKIVTITWWNEWGAERLATSSPACSGVTYCFTDNYNQEYSRDIEPMSGGHGSQYYDWMKQYIQAYKNHSSCPRLVESGY